MLDFDSYGVTDIERDGKTYRVEIERDDHHGAPWEENDCHGDVSKWTSRDKEPGELVLNEDGGSYRYYDFASTMERAKRDGWGYVPGKVTTTKNANGTWTARNEGEGHLKIGAHTWTSHNINAAISALYQLERQRVGAGQHVANAVRADFERLEAWCDDEWCYVTVGVCEVTTCECCDEEKEGEWHYLGGVESDCDDHLDDVVNTLIGEC